MIEGSVDLITYKLAYGWATDLDKPTEKLIVRALIKGRQIASCKAEMPRKDLEQFGDSGKMAFHMRYPEQEKPEEIEIYAEGENFARKLHVIRIEPFKTGYQSFEDQKGDSDSFEKLRRIGFPDRLNGKSVLDLGCNEGFFCLEAIKRGAAHVTGIDASEEYIQRARGRNSEIEYIHGSWWDIPARKYDIILFLSAMHYEKESKRLLDKLANHLTPKGTLILECGLDVTCENQAWTSVNRADGVFRYPSRNMLMKTLLERYHPRFHGKSIEQPGDAVGRYVFHATLKQPIVIFLAGPTLQGKTILATVLSRGANVLHFPIDLWMWQRKVSSLPQPTDNAIFSKIKTQCDTRALTCFIDELSPTECEDFASAVFASLPLEAECVIVEGYALERPEFRERLKALLDEKGARVWKLERF